MSFWIAAAAITIGIAMLILAALRRPAGTAAPGAEDIRIYRDQLKEVERDLARGLITAEEAARLRTEISRRILDADKAAGSSATTRGPLWVAGLLLLVATGGGVWIYSRLGAPGYSDMPMADRLAFAEELRKSRPSQAELEAANPPVAVNPAPEKDFLDLIEKLRTAMKDRPNDLQGQEYLARYEAELGDYAAAAAAQAKVVQLKSPQASGEDYADWAGLMILAAGGRVSAEAESVLSEALKRDPKNGRAMFYTGLLFEQNARPDLAFRVWRELLETGDPAGPWVPTLRRALPEAAWRAGVDYTLPPEGMAPAGPSAADVDAARDMPEADRQAMIRGMVDSLSARLASSGGSAQEWARLITSLGVLGEKDRARAIAAEAEGVFAGREGDLAAIRKAAEGAGL